MIELDLARMRAEAVLVSKIYPKPKPGSPDSHRDYYNRLPKLAADVLALLGRVAELEAMEQLVKNLVYVQLRMAAHRGARCRLGCNDGGGECAAYGALANDELDCSAKLMGQVTRC